MEMDKNGYIQHYVSFIFPSSEEYEQEEFVDNVNRAILNLDSDDFQISFEDRRPEIWSRDTQSLLRHLNTIALDFNVIFRVQVIGEISYVTFVGKNKYEKASQDVETNLEGFFAFLSSMNIRRDQVNVEPLLEQVRTILQEKTSQEYVRKAPASGPIVSPTKGEILPKNKIIVVPAPMKSATVPRAAPLKPSTQVVPKTLPQEAPKKLSQERSVSRPAGTAQPLRPPTIAQTTMAATESLPFQIENPVGTALRPLASSQNTGTSPKGGRMTASKTTLISPPKSPRRAIPTLEAKEYMYDAATTQPGPILASPVVVGSPAGSPAGSSASSPAAPSPSGDLLLGTCKISYNKLLVTEGRGGYSKDELAGFVKTDPLLTKLKISSKTKPVIRDLMLGVYDSQIKASGR